MWCIAYNRRIGGGSYVAQWYCIILATVWAMQVEEGQQTDDSILHKSLEVKEYLVKAKQ